MSVVISVVGGTYLGKYGVLLTFDGCGISGSSDSREYNPNPRNATCAMALI